MFSDPYKDFQDEVSKDILLRISLTPKHKLNSSDYLIIFQPYCSPGTVSETIPYITPFFSYISKNIYIEDLSSIMSIWDDFILWFNYHIDEINELNYKNKIFDEIENFFLNLCNIKSKISNESIYNIAIRVSETFTSYTELFHSESEKKNNLLKKLNLFDDCTLLKNIIILSLYYNALYVKQNKLKFILDIYNNQKIQIIFNETISSVLEWPMIPPDFETLLIQCENYFIIEYQ